MALIALVLGWSGPSWAAGASGAGPSFLLESIVVEETTNVSPEIIVAESRLEPGTNYTEDQLRDAIHRVVRLPFVIDADFALRKGTVRDRYELVITVVEARTWFFGADLGYRTFGPNRSTGSLRRDEFTASNLTAGKRFFVGRRGEFFVAAGGGSGPTVPEVDAAALSVGYNHYDVLGKGAVLSLAYGLQDASSLGVTHQASVSLGVPLRANQSFQLRTRYSWFDSEAPRPGRQGHDETSLASTAAWVYDSLDDPTLAREGWRIDAEVGYSRFDSQVDRVWGRDGVAGVGPDTYASDSYHVGVDGVRYWPITGRQSVSARVSARFQEWQERGAPELVAASGHRSGDWIGVAELGHQLSIFDRTDETAWRQLRWENTVAYQSQSAEFFTNVLDGEGWSAATGLIFRNRWGVYRFRFSYINTRQGLNR